MTSSEYSAFLSKIIQNADFRPQDIYVGQDDGGKEYAPSVIREWTFAQSCAAAGTILEIYFDNETDTEQEKA